jgi:hypothetical protein
MPLVPEFVQTVTARQDGARGSSFTNLSSQMMHPGTLPLFFQTQNTAEPMPFTNGDIIVAEQPITAQISERNNVSNLPRFESMPGEFRDAAREKLVRFRTASMRAWGVPLAMTETRGADTMY